MYIRVGRDVRMYVLEYPMYYSLSQVTGKVKARTLIVPDGHSGVIKTEWLDVYMADDEVW